jgi:SagB-type dehydrogenase family enzyme
MDAAPALALSLTPGARVDASNGTLLVSAPWARHALGASARELVRTLADGPMTHDETRRLVEEVAGADEQARLAADIHVLVSHRLVRELALDASGAVLATLESIAPQFSPAAVAFDSATVVALSRFSHLRRHPTGGRLVIESPLSLARVHLETLAAGTVAVGLATGASVAGIAREAALDPALVEAVVALLLRAGVADVVDEHGMLDEDGDAALRQWDFHDLLFHARSRAGRHDEPTGGQYRFLGQIAPQPAVKDAPWPMTIVLPRPDLAAVALRDPPLTAAIEGRRSVRVQEAHPIGLERLGEFLYRVGRVRARYVTDRGEYTSRPYPTGGASYEHEIYAVVDDGAGVRPGLYWYDPARHGLCLVREPGADTRALLERAVVSTAGLGRPQVLLVLAARFQRVSWKYDAIAYATILKDTGVLYQTMYLVATAMGLAPCALGLGDADLFARAAGTRYVEESSVGELMLCGAATAPR